MKENRADHMQIDVFFLTILGTGEESNTDTLDNVLGLRSSDSNLDTSLVSLIHVQTAKLETVNSISNVGVEVVVAVAGRVLGTDLDQSQSWSTNRQERWQDNTLTTQVIHGGILEGSSLLCTVSSTDNLALINHNSKVALGAELLAVLQQNLLDTREDTGLGIGCAGVLGLGDDQFGILLKLLRLSLLAPLGLVDVLDLGDTVDVDLERVGSEGEGVLLPDDNISVHANGNLSNAVVQTQSLGRHTSDGGQGQLLGEAVVASHGGLVDKVLGVEDGVIRLHGHGDTSLGQNLWRVDGALECFLLVTIDVR